MFWVDTMAVVEHHMLVQEYGLSNDVQRWRNGGWTTKVQV